MKLPVQPAKYDKNLEQQRSAIVERGVTILEDRVSASSEVTGTFDMSLTGCTTVPTGAVHYVRRGNIVVLQIPYLGGTSNTNRAALTGLPSFLRPARIQGCYVAIQDNGAANSGHVTIDTDGTVTLFRTGPSGLEDIFTSSGTKGIYANTLTYALS